MTKRKPKKNDRIKISACYIVKNGANDLRRSLEHLGKYVDEIIVVDTGSTDNTVAVAKKFGAKIFHEPWQDDFSTPRNVAINHATGDWIVFLDADEYFPDDCAQNLQRVIRMAIKNSMTIIYVKMFNVDADKGNSVIETTYLPRIFENAPSVRYVGKIHEEVERDDKPLERVMAPSDLLTIYHTGYSASIVTSKLKRNLKLLLEELETSDDPARTYGYLVDCYHGLEDWENTEKYARLEVDAQRNLSTRPMQILLDILSKDPSRVDEYFKFLKLAVERYPHLPEFSVRLAAYLAEHEDYRAAIAEMRRALFKFEHFDEHLEMTRFDEPKAEMAREFIDEWLTKIDLTPEEKSAAVARLTDKLIQAVEVTRDRETILRTAKILFALQPDEPAPVERVASIYIDYQMEEEAAQVVAYLEKFPPSLYRLLLKARFNFLRKNCRAAIQLAKQALALEDNDLLTKMLLHNLLGQAYRFIGDSRKAVEHYEFNAKLDPAALKNSPHLEQAERIRREEYSNLVFNLHNLNVSREKLFEEARGFNTLLADVPRFAHDLKLHARHKKIRIGYISPDVRFHVVAFFSAHFFTSYDKTRFEVYVYANNDADHITEQFAAAVDCFRNIAYKPAKEVAAQIVADEVDILFDLAGHSANNSLEVLAYKPAPVQISGIGYFDTTGLDAVDYFLADKFTDPEGLNEKFFTEKILRLQHSHFCYVWHDLAYPVTPAPCTAAGFVTFASFNNFAKVTDEMLGLWSKILRGVPDSRLYLKGKPFVENYGLELVKERMTAAGIDLERVDFEEFAADYVRSYERVDIALDTFPYPGGGTTCDALYMGVPVITLVGERHNSRFGYSLLANVGLTELCAFSADEYVQKAIELANDRPRLREYHLTLRRRLEESPVMNDAIYMGELEQAYEKIFSAWLRSEPLPEFPQEAAQVTIELAEEYYRRAMNYLPLEGENGKSKYNRVDFKRTLYYAELAARCSERRDAKLYLIIGDRRHMTDDNVGAYEAMREAINYLSGESNFFAAECYSKFGKYASDNRRAVEAAESYARAFELADNNVKRLKYYDSWLLSLHFTDISGAEMAAAHFDYQNLLAGVEPFATYHKRHERIRIGYISGDFRKHAMFSVMFGFMSCHDRSKFEVTCYSCNKADDEYTELFRKAVEHFVDAGGLSALELAEKIHADEIDVAVDLAGHTGDTGLPALAYRPAPLQVSGLGYMSTTGLTAIDYFITDAELDPPNQERGQFFSEKLLYIPAQFSYAQRLDLPSSSGAPCVKNGFVTFGTICRYAKINDDMLAIWTEVLNRVPTARLLMRAQEFISNKTVDELYRALKALGCDVERVTIRPAVHDYFGAIGQIDIMLDAYPYVGGATTLDALYMGVPVVNLYGERHSTRFGRSILASAGLSELAVDSVEAYIETAVALANDFETLDVLHKNLRGMFLNSDSLDPMRYCRRLEQKFAELLSERV